MENDAIGCDVDYPWQLFCWRWCCKTKPNDRGFQNTFEKELLEIWSSMDYYVPRGWHAALHFLIPCLFLISLTKIFWPVFWILDQLIKSDQEVLFETKMNNCCWNSLELYWISLYSSSLQKKERIDLDQKSVFHR